MSGADQNFQRYLIRYGNTVMMMALMGGPMTMLAGDEYQPSLFVVPNVLYTDHSPRVCHFWAAA